MRKTIKEIKASWLKRTKKSESVKEITNLKFIIKKYNTKIKKI